MKQPKLMIGVYNEVAYEIEEAYEKFKAETEAEIGYRLRKQEVWIKIIRAGFQALEQQKIQKAE
jgi:hypothetical protein